MKKTLALVIAMLMIGTCCACGDTASTDNNKDTSKETVSNNSSVQDNSSDDSVSEESKLTQGTVSLQEGTIFENFIVPDTGVEYPDSNVEYGTAPSTLDTAWNADVTAKKGNSDALAETMRKNVLYAKNTLETYKVKGTVYYVSPNGDDKNDGKSPKTAFKSVKAPIFTMNTLKPGDAVLFERGGVWRLTSAIKCKEGITYGSYGTGEKPTFYGSPYNYAVADYWVPSNRQHIWKVTVADSDIGLAVFNHGEMVGIKKLNGIIALEKNGDYYFNQKQDTLYLYCDKGNPGKVYKDIELGLNKAIFSVTNANNIVVDNFRIKYSGRFGLDMCGSDNSVITNCEIGFIGGAIQTGTTRLGNGIQMWNGVTNHRVENCWIYQIYDAALTFQGNDTYTASHMSDEYKNITYKNNLIEYSTYSFEFWHGNSEPSVSYATIENFVCTNNVSRFVGFGWGRQRADHTGNHICVFDRAFPNAKANKITDNIFDLADSYIVKWGFKTGANNGEWDISNNTYYHGPNRFGDAMRFGYQVTARDLLSLKSAIDIFEKNPKSIVWVDSN